jgi:lipase maturation factor 1
MALFGRALGLTTLVAFVSLHVQVSGLFGSGGIDPMTRRVSFLADSFGSDAFLAAPSVFFAIGGSDFALGLACVLGELAGLAMMLGVATGPAALLAYVLYLSFTSLGAPFFPLQWDTLLLESLVVATLVLPWGLRQRLDRSVEPSLIARVLVWFLVGRLMFASGFVKLASGDEAWSSLRALDDHFETQPLPVGLSYLLHFGPRWIRTLGAILTFLVELLLPFAIPFGVLGRRIAAGGFVLLMLAIALTGNYGFFNLLTVALAIPLVDDAALERLMPARLRARVGSVASAAAGVWAQRAKLVLPSLQLALSGLMLVSTLGARLPLPDLVSSLRLASTYGLFAVMTTDRPIVIFEGTLDGVEWRAYDFRYQSAEPSRGPSQCFPHMPRLDWMIWFAGLGDFEGNSWIRAVERGLLEARPDVLALFGTDPFDGERPRSVRAVRYFYRFAPPGDADRWVRTDRMPYGPALSRGD